MYTDKIEVLVLVYISHTSHVCDLICTNNRYKKVCTLYLSEMLCVENEPQWQKKKQAKQVLPMALSVLQFQVNYACTFCARNGFIKSIFEQLISINVSCWHFSESYTCQARPFVDLNISPTQLCPFEIKGCVCVVVGE